MCSEVINFIIAIRTLEKIRLKKIGLQYRPIALIRLHKPRGPKFCSFHIVSNPLPLRRLTVVLLLEASGTGDSSIRRE
ncbi:unnamed protein product [Acanthoscelides obtectus]|uniref:Uncharacterized protein n=1 Tax=Acanthoscelides obtectus TaxID=200917 RepID=A0A9P0L763_ACAOB|nr:unnamed protein product [Acanthoscelides obtectus]CAK1645812.1 hypothetical protein AOBTE_LOCUS14293 [Acanthoscelides obtectus]